MADISKIVLPGSTAVYNLKDATARGRHLYCISLTITVYPVAGSTITYCTVYVNLMWGKSSISADDLNTTLNGKWLNASGAVPNGPVTRVKFGANNSITMYYPGAFDGPRVVGALTQTSYQIF